MEGRVINARRLVALDIRLHGPRFIMPEFGLGTPAILAVGGYLALTGQLVLGLYLFLTGVNYVPLVVYAVLIVRAGLATREVADELSRDRHYVRKYSTQQLLIFIPFAVVLLAAAQELDRRPRAGPLTTRLRSL
ncbi:MAG: hypothetical protein OK442_00440 [Thaumarchaeota archaeon]|nr:hypothetical protein [Nitrososphaerota archaeon]